MDIFHLLQAIVLGLVQGLSEFLPISSSGHLTIIPWLFSWPTPPLVFDTSLHLGTALALLMFFWKDFWNMAKGFLSPSLPESKSQRSLVYMIILGMLPAGIIGVIFDKKIEHFFGDPLGVTQVMMIGGAMAFFGLLLWASDHFSKQAKQLSDMTYGKAFAVGLAQVLALFPGTSRSGITMTTALGFGFNRETAARFSFLVGAPITFAAGLFKLKDLKEVVFTQEMTLYFVLGFLASTISGYLCIRFFLSFLRKYPVTVFTVYRLLFAALIFGVAWSRFVA